MGNKKAQEYEKLALQAEADGKFGLAADLFQQASEEATDGGQKAWYARRAAAAQAQAAAETAAEKLTRLRIVHGDDGKGRAACGIQPTSAVPLLALTKDRAKMACWSCRAKLRAPDAGAQR